mmetsp:Transcript_54656/g.122260  ORF Transcript_54656/g.122260 Transcript_54656/m.122260 type:complete len:485 (+) Transcript_54656:69-1523(+)
MAPSTQHAALALAAAGCTAFVAAPSTTRAPTLRAGHANQANQGKASSSSTGVALAGLGAAVGALIAAPRREKCQKLALCAFENELGVQAPVGFWDPAGFTSDGDAKDFYRRRCVELKHGRVSMLACIGYIVQEWVRFPGYLSPSSGIAFADVPNGLKGVTVVPAVGWFQYTVFCGLADLWFADQRPFNPPGKLQTRLFGEGALNYSYGAFGIPAYLGGKPIDDPEIKKKKLNAELANGRLAMMAIIGMFFQNGLTGQAWGDWSLYTDSPLRALTPAQELIAGTGGPLPDMFWDPAGITSNKSEEEILELRQIELKHGRVAMLAVLHWFHMAAGWHPLGDWAIGQKMSNDPMVNLTQLPMGGMWQTVFFIMCLEWLTTYICKPPKNKPWDVLGWQEIIVEDYPSQYWNLYKEVQCQELNNSRLAMVAIVGLVAQDLATGDYVAGVGQFCFGGCKELTTISYEAWENVGPAFERGSQYWSSYPDIL